MSGTIAGTVQAEIILGTASSYADPLTITGAVELNAGVAAIDAMGSWTIVNQGLVTDQAGDGLILNAGGVIQNSGSIYGTQYGVLGAGKGVANLSLSNTGTIESGGTGVLMTTANDMFNNAAGGVIAGGSIGVRFTGFSPSLNTLWNAGIIEGTASAASIGVALAEAAGVNAAGGVIESSSTALSLDVLSSFVNFGTIVGQTGVSADSASATIVNAGTIEGLVGDAVLFASTGGTLALLPGEVMDGTVNGGDNGVLLLSGTTAGSLSGLGSQIINFDTIDLTQGASWDFTGTTTIAATALLENFGTLTESPADSLGIFGKLAGTGLIDVENATLVLHNAVAAGQTILLDGTQSTLVLTDPGLFNGTIAGFGGSDVIEIGGVGSSGIVTETLNGNVMTLSGAIAPTALTFASAPGTPMLIPVLGPGGKSYEITAPCFAAGTRILTTEGPKPVEALRRGDQVVTLSGAPKPIIWRGRRKIDCRRHPNPEVVWPVRIKADSFGPGLPARELYVSPDHALYVSGVLIPAKHLINGISIRQVRVRSVVYHHIELAAHDVVWAEGLPSETYLDCNNRNQFQGGKSISLHPDFAPLHWDRERSYAPLVTSGKILAEVRAGLHADLLRQGFQPQIFSEITLEADGRSLAPAIRNGNRHRFAIPPGASLLTIRSAAGIPAETDPHSEDRRQLGIAITRIIADDVAAAAEDRRFGSGFHAAEHAGRRWFRWTNGAAQLAASGMKALEFTVKGQQPVWQRPAGLALRVSSASHSQSPA